VIEEENLFVLSRRDAEVFFRPLANPPAAPPALKKAARRFAEKLGSANQRIDWSSPTENLSTLKEAVLRRKL